MSDYLNNLVARTLSLDVGVRPQLPSAFEPPSMHGVFNLAENVEMETRVESNPAASLPMTTPTPFERVPSREPPPGTPTWAPEQDELTRQVMPPPRPRSIHDGIPSPESNEDEHIAPVSPLVPPVPIGHQTSIGLCNVKPVIKAPPNSMPEQSGDFTTPHLTSRSDPLSVALHLRASLMGDTVRPAPAVIPHQTVESEVSSTPRIAAPAIQCVVPTATVLSLGSAVAPSSDTPRPAVSAVRSQTVAPGERRSERAVETAIRPVTPAVPVFSSSVRPPTASPPPSIHVTIGRVEVRATLPPPAKSRARSAVPPVMSLEEYLGRRVTGGQR